jgi:hypothetical protein
MNGVKSRVSPILTAELFPEVTGRLHELLRSLSVKEWSLPTNSSQRTVKDIASHMLDGSLRRLSMQRDGYFPPEGSGQQRADETLLEFLNRLNAEWEIGTRRLSPRVLVDLLASADRQLTELFQSLDPFGPAIFPVAWAGEEASQNWMDIARDYTEKWHHTRQIFEATNRPSTISERRLLHPCLDTFMRALPFTFSGVKAPAGTVVAVMITGDAGGEWFVERVGELWVQTPTATRAPSATVAMDADTAWRLVTKRRARDVVRREFPQIRIEGDVELGEHVLDMVAMMA